MKSIPTLLGLAALSASLAGCIASQVMRLDAVVRDAKVTADIELLLDEPNRPYIAIGLVEATDQGWGLPLERIKHRLVEEAAALGGDAVVIGREHQLAGFVAVGSSINAVTESKLVGKVIVYE